MTTWLGAFALMIGFGLPLRLWLPLDWIEPEPLSTRITLTGLAIGLSLILAGAALWLGPASMLPNADSLAIVLGGTLLIMSVCPIMLVIRHRRRTRRRAQRWA